MHILAPPVLGEADRDKPLSWKTGEIEREEAQTGQTLDHQFYCHTHDLLQGQPRSPPPPELSVLFLIEMCLRSPSSQLCLFVERPGAGEESPTVDHEHRARGAHHRLRQVHTGRLHPL